MNKKLNYILEKKLGSTKGQRHPRAGTQEFGDGGFRSGVVGGAFAWAWCAFFSQQLGFLVFFSKVFLFWDLFKIVFYSILGFLFVIFWILKSFLGFQWI